MERNVRILRHAYSIDTLGKRPKKNDKRTIGAPTTDIAGHVSFLIARIPSESKKRSKSDTEKKADAAFNEMHDVAAVGHPSSIHP